MSAIDTSASLNAISAKTCTDFTAIYTSTLLACHPSCTRWPAYPKSWPWCSWCKLARQLCSKNTWSLFRIGSCRSCTLSHTRCALTQWKSFHSNRCFHLRSWLSAMGPWFFRTRSWTGLTFLLPILWLFWLTPIPEWPMIFSDSTTKWSWFHTALFRSQVCTCTKC
jgi:hypothetical protein